MIKPQRVSDLDITQDLEFHRRELRAEKIGWLLMLLVVVAALLGVFGSGPLSKGQVRAAGGALSAEYPRFARYLAPAELRLTFDPAAVQEGALHVWLSREFLDEVQVEAITPEPDAQQLEGDRLTYTFGARNTGEPVEVVFQLRMADIGRLPGRVGLTNTTAEELRFNTLIYP
ncbi:hypothetical protein [Deinococcus sp. YIM 77859]|uniref:hypothetical protein n=1 Tax=Deinococcus sp. YIM 77859 TaxID=1540221 RepID=UPI00068D5861|nr:hypothetical protein [Deinococcus sp. YIM 77859]